MAALSPTRPASLVLTALVLVGCTGTRSTVGDSMFQKRHLRPGWHVELGGREQVRTNERGAPVARMESRSVPYRNFVSPLPVAWVEMAELENATTPSGPLAMSSVESLDAFLTRADILSFRPDTTRTAQRQQIEEPVRRWNPWAIPAFAAAVGTVVLALATGTSAILVILALVLTLILAVIALRKGRKNEWSGKGFAVAAMMIGSLATLITLIALLSGGAK